MLFYPTRLFCLCGLLWSAAAAAGAEQQQPMPTPAEPDLASLATPPDVAAAGEASSARSVAGLKAKAVEVDGETVELEERDVELEGTSFKALYRRGPSHVPK